MSSRLKGSILLILYTTFVLAVPSISIYVDYNNYKSIQDDTRFTYQINLTPSNSTKFVNIGEFPEFTFFRIFMHRNSTINNQTEFFLLDEHIIDRFIAGQYPRLLPPNIITSEPVFSGWINETIVEEGEIILFARGINLTDNVDISGYYYYQLEEYLAERLFLIFTWTGLWLIITISIIPRLRNMIKKRNIYKKLIEDRRKEEREYEKLLNRK